MVDINPTVIAFNLNGPNNLGLSVIDESEDDLPLMPGSSVRVQRGDTYFTDETGKFTAGIWECTPCQTALGPYPVNEFMILLVGSVILIDEKGNEMTFQAGEAFVIPKGMVVSWKQNEVVRKFYAMTLDENMANGPSDTLIPRRIINIPDESEIMEAVAYSDPSKQFTVGCTRIILRGGPIPFSTSDTLLHVVDGKIIITIGGVARMFTKGNTFLIPKGTRCELDSEFLGHAIFCSWEPNKLGDGGLVIQAPFQAPSLYNIH
jgi:uncharacterized cupin superfamily protein